MASVRMGLSARIIVALLLAALLPIALTGIGAWIVFGGLLKDKSRELQRHVVEAHARSVELYLQERQRALQVLASVHTLERLRDPAHLRALLDDVDTGHGRASFGKRLCKCPPDAAARAGDDSDFVLEFHRRASWWMVVPDDPH